LTFTVIAGYAEPPARVSDLVQTLAAFGLPQVQPVPAIETSVRPIGGVSVTVTAFEPEELTAKFTV
jgi:hypothetical protein